MKKWITILLMSFLLMPLYASNGDTLNIGGVVPLQLDLTVDPSPYSPDDLTLVAGVTTAVTALSIADITIATNNTAGWELWVMSANAGTLVNDDADTIGYTLTYAGTGGVAAASPLVAGTKLGEAAADVDETAILSINYSQEPNYPAGYYTDQLTVILRAK